MVNHPNRSKQQQPKLSDMTGYEPDNVMIVEREEAAAVKMRVEGYEALKALNAELLAALKQSLIPLGFFEAALRAIEQPPSLDGISTSCDITVDVDMDSTRKGAAAFKMIRDVIAKAEGH